MFEIIYILMEKKTVTAGELAKRFEVSTRTIYRDVETLSAAGIPIFMSKGKGGGISILEHFILNKTVLTEEEKTDVLSAMEAIGSLNLNSSNSALKKLSSLFGDQNADWIEVDFSSWYQFEKESETFNNLKQAILSKFKIKFTYSSSKSQQTTREVEPLKLCFKGMSRYLYGYCSLRNDFRFFKLSRIRELTITDKKFDRVALSPVFKESSPPKEEMIALTLRLSPNMAFRVYDEFDQYTKEADGSFLVQTTYPQGEWLFPYISSFGSNCEILAPTYLRDKFISDLQRTLKNYK